MKTLQVLIADDHELVRRGLRALIESEPTLEVCAEARDGAEALRLAREYEPDIVVLDLNMPVLHGGDALGHIRRAIPAARVIVVSFDVSSEMRDELLEGGADAVLDKSDGADQLLSVMRGGAHAASLKRPRRTRTSGRARQSGEARPPLTAREAQVLRLIAEGRTTRAVADELGVSLKTAETHRTNVMRKLRVHSAVELVRNAIRLGLIEP